MTNKIDHAARLEEAFKEIGWDDFNEAATYIRTLEELVRDSLQHLKFGPTHGGEHIRRRAEEIGISIND